MVCKLCVPVNLSFIKLCIKMASLKLYLSVMVSIFNL